MIVTVTFTLPGEALEKFAPELQGDRLNKYARAMTVQALMREVANNVQREMAQAFGDEDVHRKEKPGDD